MGQLIIRIEEAFTARLLRREGEMGHRAVSRVG